MEYGPLIEKYGLTTGVVCFLLYGLFVKPLWVPIWMYKSIVRDRDEWKTVSQQWSETLRNYGELLSTLMAEIKSLREQVSTLEEGVRFLTRGNRK